MPVKYIIDPRETDSTKVCTLCKELLDLDLFHKSSKGRKGRLSQCKNCQIKAAKEKRKTKQTEGRTSRLSENEKAKRIQELKDRGIELTQSFISMNAYTRLRCTAKGHEWEAMLINVYHGKTGCPTCSGRFNDQMLKRLAEGFKNCSKCNQEKPLVDFHRSIKESSGYESRCKLCSKKQDLVKRNQIKSQTLIIIPTVAEKTCSKCKRLFNADKFRLTAYTKDKLSSWCIDCRNEDHRQYKKSHKSEELHRVRLRQMKKLQATPSWANLEAIKQIYIKCEQMSIDTGIPHHVDHIDPINHPLVCGLHVENNLQILTEQENLKKNNKFTPYFL